MRSRIRTLAAAAVLAMCWWLCLGAAPAVAHTELQSSSPGQGEVLDAAPKTVRLTFTEDVGSGSLAVTVSGQSVGAGPARVDGADLVLDIAAGSPAGAWNVGFRVVSADGHPVTGQFAFTVEPEGATARPTPADTLSPTPSPTPSSTPTATTHPSGHSGMAAETPAVEVTVTVLALAALLVGVFARRRRD